MREEEFLAILQAAMRQTALGGRPVTPQIVTGLGTGGMIAHLSMQPPYWFSDAKFAHTRIIDTQRAVQTRDEEGETLYVLLSQATSAQHAADVVVDAIVRKIAKSMMIPVSDIDSARLIGTYGVDSLVAVELRTWVLKEVQADVSVFEILGNMPMTTLRGRLWRRANACQLGFWRLRRKTQQATLYERGSMFGDTTKMLATVRMNRYRTFV